VALGVRVIGSLRHPMILSRSDSLTQWRGDAVSSRPNRWDTQSHNHGIIGSRGDRVTPSPGYRHQAVTV
jgi:hypothetical protein